MLSGCFCCMHNQCQQAACDIARLSHGVDAPPALQHVTALQHCIGSRHRFQFFYITFMHAEHYGNGHLALCRNGLPAQITKAAMLPTGVCECKLAAS